MVALRSAIMAGPSTKSPGLAASRSTSAASHQRPPLKSRTVSAAAMGAAGNKGCADSAGASPAPTASTDTASTTSARSFIRKAKRWR